MSPSSTVLGAAPFVPDSERLEEVAEAARSCRGCHLYEDADQTVFGAGPVGARIVLVGEQPGDVEDRRGEPFVGPAGRLLDRALGDAEIERADVYVTNSVKHFKWVPAERGTRRIHKTPSRTEVVACRPWLFTELRLIEPEVVATIHPSAVLRAQGDARDDAFDGLVADLRLASAESGST